MPAIRTIAAALLLPTALGGCTSERPPKPAEAAPRPDAFEQAHRAAVELGSAQEVGMDRRRFGELLERLATEISLAREKAEAPEEQRTAQAYADVLQIYKDAAAIWDVKLSVPEIREIAERQARAGVAAGSIDLVLQNGEFQKALDGGIPLNLFRPGSTGIDELVARYQLPVAETKEGWRTIPNDSVERVCTRAGEKAREVAKARKG